MNRKLLNENEIEENLNVKRQKIESTSDEPELENESDEINCDEEEILNENVETFANSVGIKDRINPNFKRFNGLIKQM